MKKNIIILSSISLISSISLLSCWSITNLDRINFYDNFHTTKNSSINSIVDYSNFIYFTNEDSSQINMYGYKNDVLNNYYTYAIENSDKANNTLLNFKEQTIDKVSINNKSLASFKAINLQNLIINNKPTLLRIKITPSTVSTIANSLYYGYNSQDNTINFNLIVYPAYYSTFHNYIDFNKVYNQKFYNMDLKIHIDKSLLNYLNINKLDTDDSTGFLDTFDFTSNSINPGWGWANYQGNNIDQVLNSILFVSLNNYITNPNHVAWLGKETDYTYGLMKLLNSYWNQNICFNIKFCLEDNQFFPSSIYNNFSNLPANELFYKQIVS